MRLLSSSLRRVLAAAGIDIPTSDDPASKRSNRIKSPRFYRSSTLGEVTLAENREKDRSAVALIDELDIDLEFDGAHKAVARIMEAGKTLRSDQTPDSLPLETREVVEKLRNAVAKAEVNHCARMKEYYRMIDALQSRIAPHYQGIEHKVNSISVESDVSQQDYHGQSGEFSLAHPAGKKTKRIGSGVWLRSLFR